MFPRSLVFILLSLAAFAADRPNVVVIFTDDHRYTGIHALGGQAVQTPHLDQLVREGFVFDHAYLQGSFSGATCIPSRASLLTGKHLFELVQPGHTLPPEHTTLGEVFMAAGYHAHVVGKWHQDHASLARSFNSGATLMGLGTYLVDQFRMPLWDWNPAGRYTRESAYLLEFGEGGEVVRRGLTPHDQRGPIGTENTGPHTSEVFADAAIDFIGTDDRDQPYFMYVAFHAPHDPRQAPQAYRDLHPVDEIELPPSYAPQHPFDNGHIVLRDEQLAPWPRTPAIARRELADYYAIISHLDAQIGRMIAALKASGSYENTLIVMAGDSGLAVGNHGLLGKQSVYDEDGVHVPLIFAGGALARTGRSDAVVYLQDIFPTLCDLTAMATPDSVSGSSLAGILRGEQARVRDDTYHAYLHYQRAYRKGDYKLIEYVRAPGQDKQVYGHAVRGSRVTQLFNFKEDPWETRDLSAHPEYADRIATMRQGMRRAAVAFGDTGDQLINYGFDFWKYYQN